MISKKTESQLALSLKGTLCLGPFNHIPCLSHQQENVQTAKRPSEQNHDVNDQRFQLDLPGRMGMIIGRNWHIKHLILDGHNSGILLILNSNPAKRLIAVLSGLQSALPVRRLSHLRTPAYANEFAKTPHHGNYHDPHDPQRHLKRGRKSDIIAFTNQTEIKLKTTAPKFNAYSQGT